MADGKGPYGKRVWTTRPTTLLALLLPIALAACNNRASGLPAAPVPDRGYLCQPGPDTPQEDESHCEENKSHHDHHQHGN